MEDEGGTSECYLAPEESPAVFENRLHTTEVTVPSQLLNISPGRAATVEKVVVKPAERFYPSATMLLQRKDLCKTCNLAGM